MTLWIAVGVGAVLLLWLLSGVSSRPNSAPPTPQERGLLEAELRDAMATGRKIDAIKAYRLLHGTDLKDSKDAVERAMPGPA
jgi:ribosomal protein L7/L12